MTLQLLERDRVRVHADFVLNNLARPTDKFIEAARQRKHPDRAVFFDADKLVADAKARFKLPKNQRDARSWDAVARDLLERAAAEVTKDDECLFDRRSNGLKMDDLPKYQWILHATAEIVCIDSSSPLVEPAYTARALKTMLITTALISDAWIDYVSARKVGAPSSLPATRKCTNAGSTRLSRRRLRASPTARPGSGLRPLARRTSRPKTPTRRRPRSARPSSGTGSLPSTRATATV